ncbi:Inositol phosphoceramide mannosyltransferase 2 [Chlorella vulgaris]
MHSPRCKGAMPRLRLAIAAATIFALVLLCWPHLTMFAAAGYSYAWWLRPEVHWAVPAQLDDDSLRPVVPKIMHQTWQTTKVPKKWQAARQSCLDLHPEYEHRLWTDADGLEFIEEHYPWFLPTYLSYPYNIQRVDVLRYFILHKLGGVYIDLDMGCRHNLDFMLLHNFTAPMTHPVGISNDVMAARPGDAYLGHLLPRLAHWNRWLGIKYIQVMFSTGPMFLTVQYSLFPGRRDVGIIPKPTYGKYDFSGDAYFYHLHGSSWHANDASFIFWMDRHKLALVLLGSLLAAGLAGAVCFKCVLQRGYRQLKSEE